MEQNTFNWWNLDEQPYYKLKEVCQEKSILPGRICTKDELINILIEYRDSNLEPEKDAPQLNNYSTKSRSPSPLPKQEIDIMPKNRTNPCGFKILFFYILIVLIFLGVFFFIIPSK